MIIHDVAQGSEEWFALRAGVPTASEAAKLITSTGKESKQIVGYAYQLAGELYAGKPLDRWEGNSYTDRGRELENEAMVAYEQHTSTWVEHVGFCTEGGCGCSPDGLLDNGMVEIKCLAAKNHVQVMVYYTKHKKAMPDYIPQTQMQLLVTKKEWCDLVFYHPDLPMLIIKQEPDEDLQKLLIEQLIKCVDLRDGALEIIEKGGITA